MCKNNKIPIAAYCRVSTEKEDQLSSLLSQKKFFEDYSKLNNYELVQLYADEGISGTKLKNRKAFNKMMIDADKGIFKKVFVKDISRFARNAVDFLNSIRTLKEKGIKCEFINSNLSTEDGEFTLGILALVAQEESANISKRVKFGKVKNAERGKVPNLVYGYNKICGELFNLKINNYEAEIVKKIFSMYTTEGMGANKIAKYLNDNSIKTKRNCKWTQTSVTRILKNPIYTGVIINRKEEILDFLTGKRIKNKKDKWLIKNNPSISIIDENMFKKAQDILNKRFESFKSENRRNISNYPMSTLIKCDCCNHFFVRVRKKLKTKEYIKWCCGGRKSYGAEYCQNKTYIDEKEFINKLKSFIFQLIINDKTVKSRIYKLLKKSINNQSESLEVCNFKKELNKLAKIKQKQIEMYEADTISIDELKERTNELNNKINFYKNAIKNMELKNKNINVKSLLDNLFLNSENLFFEGFIDNVFLKNIINSVIVTKDGEINIYFKETSENFNNLK